MNNLILLQSYMKSYSLSFNRATSNMKQVCFAPMSITYLVDNLSNSQYKQDIWWSPDEMDTFNSNAQSLVHYLQQLKEKDLKNITNMFGLEKYLTVQLNIEFSIRRIKLKRVVLDQARRKTTGHPYADADILAQMSKKNSNWAQKRARTSALVLSLDEECQANAAQYCQILLLDKYQFGPTTTR